MLGERLRRELAAVRERAVEPILAVLVAVAARLDEAVREEAERGSGLERRLRRLVRLVRLDAEREAARREQADRAVGGQDADRRDARRSRPKTAPWSGSTVTQTIVTKFPPASSPNATSFACARSAAGSGYSRTSDRNANFASAMSAVAAIPCPLASPSTTASSPSGQRQEVVDVTSDLDPGRRLVDGADLEPLDLGQPAREQRALHRVGEVLPLLGQARVVDRERGLAGDEHGGLDLLVAEPPSRIERDDGQRGEQLCRGGDRDDERGRALLEERDEQLVRLAEPSRCRRDRA